MPLNIENKITLRKAALAIIGGLITITIFRYALSLTLQWRYGIDTDTRYMGRARFPVAVVFTIIISSFIGAFFAGSVTKRKGWLFGLLLVLIPNSFLKPLTKLILQHIMTDENTTYFDERLMNVRPAFITNPQPT